MHPTRWRRSTHLAVGLGVLAMVAVIVAAAVLLTGAHGNGRNRIPDPVPAAADPGVVPVDSSAPVPTTAGLTAALAPSLANPDLGVITGRVADAQTGKLLWQQGSDVPMQPASTNKVLTAAAALLTLERDERVSTRVMAAESSARPGVIVLVGGGDPTLSAAPADEATWYPGAARISDLAAQVRDSGVTPTSILVDTSLYTGPAMAPR